MKQGDTFLSYISDNKNTIKFKFEKKDILCNYKSSIPDPEIPFFMKKNRG